jgi:hypothetical protein
MEGVKFLLGSESPFHQKAWKRKRITYTDTSSLSDFSLQELKAESLVVGAIVVNSAALKAGDPPHRSSDAGMALSATRTTK